MFLFKFIFCALQNYHERHWENSTDTANWYEREKSKILLESIEIFLKLKNLRLNLNALNLSSPLASLTKIIR